MKKIVHIYLVIIIGFTSACQVETVGTPLLPFFDITDFLEKEITQLAHLKSIKKIVYINEKTEQQILDSFDIKKDLEVFKNSNINKTVWLDKYKVDSIFDKSGALAELQYHALDEKLKTREMIVNFNKKDVASIFIKNKSANQVSSLEQNLEYFSKKGYSVESHQKVTLGKKQFTNVEVTYLGL